MLAYQFSKCFECVLLIESQGCLHKAVTSHCPRIFHTVLFQNYAPKFTREDCFVDKCWTKTSDEFLLNLGKT